MDDSKRNLVLSGVTVVALGLAAYFYFSGGEAVALPKMVNAEVVCLHCKEESLISYDRAAFPPYTCPACGERAAYPWLYCYDCNRKFVPTLIEREGHDLPIPTPFPTCTYCGCRNVSAYSTELPNQTPVGNAKLPKWPPK